MVDISSKSAYYPAFKAYSYEPSEGIVATYECKVGEN